jgi:hypothetical protein
LGYGFTNNTGQTLESFTLSYDGEQWATVETERLWRRG